MIDPFGSSGTTAIAALPERGDCVPIDGNVRYRELAYQRITQGCHAENFEVTFNHVRGRLPQMSAGGSSEQMTSILNDRHALYGAEPVRR